MPPFSVLACVNRSKTSSSISGAIGAAGIGRDDDRDFPLAFGSQRDTTAGEVNWSACSADSTALAAVLGDSFPRRLL
jgi:hypothetical protein